MPGYVSIQQDVIQVCAEWPRDAYSLWLWSLITAYQHRITGVICCSKPIILIESRLDGDEYDVAAAWLVRHKHWLIEEPYIWVIKRGNNELWGNDGQPILNSVTSARNYLLNRANSIPSAIIEGFFDRYGTVLGALSEGYVRASGGGGDGVPADSDSDSDSEAEAEGRGRSSPNPKGEKKSPPRSPNLPAEAGKKQPKPAESKARHADPHGRKKSGKTGASNKSPPELARIWANQMLHAVQELCTEEYIKGNRGDAQKLEDLGLDVEKWEKLVFKGNQKELVKAWRQAIDAGEARGD